VSHPAATSHFGFSTLEKACRPNSHPFRAAEFLARPIAAGYVT